MLTTEELWLVGTVTVCVLFIFVVIVRIAFRFKGSHLHCQKCNYDLRACKNDTCSECGTKHASKFRISFLRPYFSVFALLTILSLSPFIQWENVWVAIRWSVGDMVKVVKEHDLGNGLIVQECEYIEDWGEIACDGNLGIRVYRYGNLLKEEIFFTNAQKIYFEDINGNGSIDCRFENGIGGNNDYSTSYIYDPLLEKVHTTGTGYFEDINEDGVQEFFSRDVNLWYKWNIAGCYEPWIYVIKTWDKKRGKWNGWQVNRDLNRKPLPSDEKFQIQVDDIRSCIEGRSRSSHDVNAACLLQEMMEYCFTGNVEVAFELLDAAWIGDYSSKVVFEEKFIEALKHCENTKMLAQFGLFDEAGRRSCNRIVITDQ